MIHERRRATKIVRFFQWKIHIIGINGNAPNWLASGAGGLLPAFSNRKPSQLLAAKAVNAAKINLAKLYFGCFGFSIGFPY